MSYTRFAIFYLPPDGALAQAGAAWLGWDAATGREVAQPKVKGLGDITMTPRKYGFHGTLKPPFRLAERWCDDSAEGLRRLSDAIAGIAARCPPARCGGLRLSRLGRFLALTPVGDASPIARVAATFLQEADGFRARPATEEIARRRKAGLSARQEALLVAWGYPYVMDEFRFHMTLTGTLPAAETDRWAKLTEAHLPALPAPFVLDEIALTGQRQDGMFELIQRYALTG